MGLVIHTEISKKLLSCKTYTSTTAEEGAPGNHFAVFTIALRYLYDKRCLYLFHCWMVRTGMWFQKQINKILRWVFFLPITKCIYLQLTSHPSFPFPPLLHPLEIKIMKLLKKHMGCTALFPVVRLAVLAPCQTPRVSVNLRLPSQQNPSSRAPQAARSRGAGGGAMRRERLYLPRSLAEPGAPGAAASTPGRGGRAGGRSECLAEAAERRSHRRAGKGAPPEPP